MAKINPLALTFISIYSYQFTNCARSDRNSSTFLRLDRLSTFFTIPKSANRQLHQPEF